VNYCQFFTAYEHGKRCVLLAVVGKSVCLSVRRVLMLCQNYIS